MNNKRFAVSMLVILTLIAAPFFPGKVFAGRDCEGQYESDVAGCMAYYNHWYELPLKAACEVGAATMLAICLANNWVQSPQQ